MSLFDPIVTITFYELDDESKEILTKEFVTEGSYKGFLEAMGDKIEITSETRI